MNYNTNELTAEQMARLEKLKEIFSDEQNQEKVRKMRTAEDVIAFYEENGFSYSEDDKKKIREVFEELKEKNNDGELSTDDLEKIVGGWDWGGFISGATGGGLVGGIVGGGLAALLGSNPVGWAIGGVLLVGGGLGAAIGTYAK